MSNELAVRNETPLNDIIKMSEIVAASGCFGPMKTNQVAALGLLAQATGRHPMALIREFHFQSDGKVARKAEALWSDYLRGGGKYKFTERTDKAVAGQFWLEGGDRIEVRFTWDDAKRIGLADKTVWRQYPRQMMTWRVVTEAVRLLMPWASCGMPVSEEMAGFSMESASEPKSKAVTAEVVATVKAEEPIVHWSDRPSAIESEVVTVSTEPIPTPTISTPEMIDQLRKLASELFGIVGKEAGTQRIGDLLNDMGGGAKRFAEVPVDKLPAMLTQLRNEVAEIKASSAESVISD